MELIAETRKRCQELADQIEAVCDQPFSFDGDHPNSHSAFNHTHLWWLEYWADRFAWIDLGIRVACAETMLARWRARLKGHAPYQSTGYRLYLYEDLAPTLSAVAETSIGFPYPGEPTFVDHPRDIMALYAGRSWAEVFQDADIPSDKQILAAVKANAGSIGRPTANRLGTKPGALRKLIENWDLQDEVNALRKHFGRRPAKFRSDETLPHRYRIYEDRLPPGYA